MNFNDIFEEIKNSPDKHPRGCEDYKKIESKLLEVVKKSGFVSGGSGNDNYGPFGDISLPYFKMGAIDSLDLFGLDEMIIFSISSLSQGSKTELKFLPPINSLSEERIQLQQSITFSIG